MQVKHVALDLEPLGAGAFFAQPRDFVGVRLTLQRIGVQLRRLASYFSKAASNCLVRVAASPFRDRNTALPLCT